MTFLRLALRRNTGIALSLSVLALGCIGAAASAEAPGATVPPVARPPAPPAALMPLWERSDHWRAEPGIELADIARDWGRRVGVTPVIKGDYSYPLESPIAFDGNYRDAMDNLVRSFSTASPPPLIHFWSDGPNFAVQLLLGSP